MRIGFRFRWVPFVAAVLVAGLGVALAQWQEGRAEQKMALEAKRAAGDAAAPLVLGAAPLAPEAVELRRVVVSGQFVPGWALYLENRPYQGHAGFYLLMPFRIADSNMHVLVERGWLPRHSAERARLPVYATPSGKVTIEGVAKRNPGHVMQLGSAPLLRPNAIVQNVDVEQVAEASGLTLQPFVLEQSGAADDHLVRDWPPPSLGVEKHRAYAFQWYALALMALLFFLVTGLRRGTS
jgi:surfeit locus 1 family protein